MYTRKQEYTLSYMERVLLTVPSSKALMLDIFVFDW